VRKLFVTTILFILMMAFSLGENVNLFFDANTEPDVLFYNIYQTTTSGGPYGVPVGAVTQGISPIMFTVTNVDLSICPCWYVVTALNAPASESPFSPESPEVNQPTVTPPSAPAPPTVTVTTTTTVTVSP